MSFYAYTVSTMLPRVIPVDQYLPSSMSSLRWLWLLPLNGAEQAGGRSRGSAESPIRGAWLSLPQAAWLMGVERPGSDASGFRPEVRVSQGHPQCVKGRFPARGIQR